jgi:predicted RecA/RadA family phage recombinase
MALKLRENIIGDMTLPNGGAALTQGTVVMLSSSEVVCTTASSDIPVGVATEAADADAGAVRVAYSGIVLCRAHDGDIAEGELVIAVASGRIDTAVAFTTGTQYVLGQALQASSAQDQLIAVRLGIQGAPKAAA